MDGIIISINVTPIIREFYMCINEGSDIIICKRRDYLSEKIKYLLKRPPAKYKPQNDLSAKLKVQLCEFHILNKRLFIEYKNYLDPQSNRIVFNELNTAFKNTFHNYVAGFVSARELTPGCQKEAIEDFCAIYNLNCDKINFEMLKKSWDRSEEKKDVEELLDNKKEVKNNMFPNLMFRNVSKLLLNNSI